ncbi:hypothetical protein O7605_11560 [Verrucosispora sp. WMMA2121]|uniref:hypothetical protein n=1 Tax=Verrucosispora sp. WMMA2121 TaxID=3015164 RepID=UPI0022B6A785|nr:hypothetical protein [Verrucosispora sp. WMMA2121]MCZ7420150.1 hypothetical protein [Verrucosispora sp. WMMA2121]
MLDGDGYRTLVAGATYDFLAAMHGRVAVGDGGPPEHLPPVPVGCAPAGASVAVL